MRNPYAAYVEAEANTTPAEKLVMMLYDEGLRVLEKAKDSLTRKDMDSFHQAADFAYRIVNELQEGLNFNAGELAFRLNQLYTYIKSEIGMARREKSIEHLDNGKRVLEELASGWRGMLERAKQGGSLGAGM